MRSSSAAPRMLTARWVSFLGAAVLVAGLGLAAPAAAAATRPAAKPAPAGGAPGGDPGLRTYQTPQQASAQAIRTDKKVAVTGSTTPLSTLTANPNGTFTLTESTAPVRAKVRGAWRNLDPALVRNSDGTYSPAVSSEPLTLSGGGAGPLATMTYGSYSLAVTAPMRLPAPVIAGDTATYRGVLPGVDLIVTAQPSGGFSDLLRIATAKAAANPALAALTFTAKTTGVSLKAAGNGVVSAITKTGQVIFAAPAPLMWDSANTPAPSAVAGSPGARAGEDTGVPTLSTTSGPGSGAHTGQLGVRLAGGRMTLVPDRQLLTGPGAVYPEYLDPTWDAAGSSASSWAYVSQQFPAQEYYDTSSTLQVGQDPNATSYTSYSFYTLPLPSQVDGAVIDTAYAYFPEVWAYSCVSDPGSAYAVELWLTGTISSSTTWDNQPAWDSELGSDDADYGWSPSGVAGGAPPSGDPQCGDNDVAYTVTSAVKTGAADKWPTVTVGLKATDTSDATGWKQFADPDSSPSGNATLSITYADTPATPVLSTSPAASCAAGTSVLGNGDVTLDATANDVNGTATGSLSVSYNAYADGNTADTFDTSLPASVSAASGTTAALILPAASVETAVSKYASTSDPDQVSITWTATVSDGLTGVPSSPTASCTFIFSTAVPGEPQIFDSAGNPGCDTLAYTVGSPASFTLEPNGTSSAATEPTAYIYQLNGGNSVTVPASTSAPYSAAITVTPTGFTNVLTVEAAIAGTNIGQAGSCVINAAAPGPAVDQDLTGDGIPDLLTVGNGTTGTASGLWLAAGQGNSSGQFDGTVDTTATDIAPLGPQDLGTPASWNGWKVITGQFDDPGGPGFNDVEAYQPGTQDVTILMGNGNGTIASSQPLNLTDVFYDTDYAGSGNMIYPQQLVNAYHISGDTQNSYVDQIGLFNDSDAGAYLAYFENSNSDASFDADNYYSLPYELTNTSPDGSMDWTDWTITTGNDTPGDATGTDMWLWNQTTGALYLWQLTGLTGQTPGGFNTTTLTNTNPAATLSCASTSGSGTGSCGLSGTQTEVSADWDQGATLDTLQATHIDGEPGVITVNSSGQVQSWYLANGTTLTQANSTQQLLTADHTWLLNQDSSGTVSTAPDQPGAGDTEQDLTGYGGATWNSGDPVFSPDVALNGTSAYLATGSKAGAFAPDSSFTVSAWVNPSALGGTVFSEDGTDDSSVEVSSTTGGQWSMAMNTGGTTTSSYTSVTGGTAHAGVWTSLTLTFDTVGGADILELYANGVEIAYLRDTTPPAVTGDFVLGAGQSGGSYGGFLAGQLADVQVWDDLAIPVQPASPDSAFVPVTPVRIMDTRSASQIGPVTGPVAASSTTLVPIDGNTTAGLPATGITAVAVSITVTGQTAAGNLIAYPGDTPLPATSTVNFVSGSPATTNNAIVPVGPDGDIALYNQSAGTAQLLVDLTGYFTTDTAASGASTYTPLATPTRILDTRNGTGAPEAEIASGGTLTLTMAGDDTNGADLPSTGITAVALNLTVVPAASGDEGYLVTYPDGVTRPSISNLWYDATADQSQAGTVIIPVGSDGKIDVYNDGPAVNLVGDLSGYFTTSTTGQYYHPLDSTRIIDTRQTTALASDSSRTIADPGNILADNPTLVLNITVTDPADGGFLQAYPGSAARPTSSIVDFAVGETVPNLALVSTSDDNSFSIYNDSAGTVQIVIDTDGYFE
jgi:hypothetical protein